MCAWLVLFSFSITSNLVKLKRWELIFKGKSLIRTIEGTKKNNTNLRETRWQNRQSTSTVKQDEGVPDLFRGRPRR